MTRDLADRTLRLATPNPTPDERELAVGDVVDGRFAIEGVLGRGAMGIVYAAVHRGTGRPVALKVLAAGLSRSCEPARRFALEARSAAAIAHDGVVQVLDAGALPDGRPYLVMERVYGRSLLDALVACGTMSPSRACRIVRDVARAVAAAHAVGIVHRDLKPENILVVDGEGGERIKVLDFGIAGRLGLARGTAPGTILGTPAYMAPEQGEGPPDPALDVYALGALLFELCAGGPPFEGAPLDVLARKTSLPAPRLDARVTGIPLALADLVDECLAIDPRARPPSASRLADGLDGVLRALAADDSAASTRAIAPMHVGPRRRRGTIASVAGAGTIAFVAVAAVASRGPHPAAGAPVRATAPERQASPRPHGEDPVPPAAAIARRPTVDAPALDAAPARDRTDPVTTRRRARAMARAAAPAPSAPPRRTAAAVDAAECARDRRRAVEARAAHDWTTVLRTTARRACWPSEDDRVRLRVVALLESARFRECMELGASWSARDSTVARALRLCVARDARGS
jgi:serine/threonine-protein kinase